MPGRDLQGVEHINSDFGQVGDDFGDGAAAVKGHLGAGQFVNAPEEPGMSGFDVPKVVRLSHLQARLCAQVVGAEDDVTS